MLSRTLKFCYHCTVYTIGVFVLLAAVTVTLIRLALPDIGIYRGEIEAWVSNYMDFPIVIRSLDATWQGWIPELYLTDIDLLNKAGTHPITRFDSARLQIDPIATLVERQFIPRNLVISGFDLTVAHLSNGSIYIEGVKMEGAEENDSTGPGNTELAEWLFKQDEIKILNANIRWIDIKNQQDPIQLSDVNVELRNDVGHFQVEGVANLPEEYGEKMEFAFDAFGNLLSADWSGVMYISGDQINPDNWYTRYRPPNVNISGGIADIKVWSNWQAGQLDSFEGQLDYEDFHATSGLKSLHIQELSYNFAGHKNPMDDWNFQIKLNEFQTENGYWPGTDISFNLESIDGDQKNNFRYLASFSYLKLDDLSSLINDFSIFPEEVRERIKDITFNGELKNGTIIYDPQKPPLEQLEIDVVFDNLSSDFNNDLPSFTGLTGNIQGSLTEGLITLHDNSTYIYIPDYGIDKLEFQNIDGKVNWSRKDDSWELSTSMMSLHTADFPALLSGRITKEHSDASAFVDLVVDIQETDVDKLYKYVPYTDKFRFRKWLQRAAVAGTLDSASALFRGYLKDFPFDNKDGRFQFIADVSDATLDYSDFWPIVDKLDVEILIDGRELIANIQNGMIFEAGITDATAKLDNILQKWKTLGLTGNIQGRTKDLGLFIDQSPLSKNQTLNEVGKAITAGSIDLDLDLGIPLKYHGQKQDKVSDINGQITFEDTEIHSPSMKLTINEINGNVDFTRTGIHAENVVGNYIEQPVVISLSGDSADQERPPTITLSGHNDHRFIIDRLASYVPATETIKSYLIDHSAGDTDWEVSLAYARDPVENKLVKKLALYTDLKGISLDLPAPFKKASNLPTDIRLYSDLVTSGIQEMTVSFGPELRGKFELNKDKEITKRLQHVSLNLGTQGGDISSELRGFPVRGEISAVSVAEWLEVIKVIRAANKPSHPIVEHIDLDLDIARLDLFNRDYANVNARISKDDSDWFITLDSEKLKGDVSLPSKMDRDKIIALDMQRLYLVATTNTETGDKLDPLTLPSIALHAEDFKYLDRELGNFQMTAAATDYGLAVDHFQFTKEELTIHGEGQWYVERGVETSNFNITLNATHMDAMLQTFGYGSSPVKDGETYLGIVADWQGSPMDFSMGKLNGTLSMNINKGSFLEIDPSAGRLFGLLSLQTLPRRLLLDFSDIFGKGMGFDSIEGNFDITNGNAYTNNLFMTGPAADIAISGRTGLADQDYDQIVTVTPQIAGTITGASALFGPVGIGVGAVMYLFNSINHNIDKILQAKYTIKGSWKEPVIEKIKSNNDDVVAESGSAFVP